MGGLEPAGPGNVGVDDDRLDVLGGELPGPAGHLRIAETVERERRLEVVAVDVTGEHQLIGGLRGAQRPGAELLVLEHLGVAQGDLRARRAGDCEAQPAHEVLPEVEQRLPGGRGPDLLGPTGLVPSDQRGGLFDQRGPVDLGDAHGAGVAGSERAVFVLAVVDRREGDRRIGRGPGLVGGDGLGGAVRVGDDQGGEESVLRPRSWRRRRRSRSRRSTSRGPGAPTARSPRRRSVPAR